MNLPDKFKIVIITLSDRASRGEYEDLSGPAVRNIIEDFFRQTGWNFETVNVIIGDEREKLESLLSEHSDKANLIITTGGTGIGPRDITVDTVKPLLDKELPGIMEYIRIKYGSQKPNALLSRSVAGIVGKCLIYTLPGSVKAVKEYLSEILLTLEHTYYMLYEIDNHRKN